SKYTKVNALQTFICPILSHCGTKSTRNEVKNELILMAITPFTSVICCRYHDAPADLRRCRSRSADYPSGNASEDDYTGTRMVGCAALRPVGAVSARNPLDKRFEYYHF